MLSLSVVSTGRRSQLTSRGIPRDTGSAGGACGCKGRYFRNTEDEGAGRRTEGVSSCEAGPMFSSEATPKANGRMAGVVGKKVQKVEVRTRNDSNFMMS
jgi:hypothetical protein